jgi:polyhydroxyalkanoate synthesis regulator phasin
MTNEDVFDMSVTSEGSNHAMGNKLLRLWSRLNEHLSPEAKSHLKDMLKQYKGVHDSEKKDFEEKLKQQLTNHFSSVVTNHYISEMMNSTLAGVCAATLCLLFGMNLIFKFFNR